MAYGFTYPQTHFVTFLSERYKLQNIAAKPTESHFP